MVWSSKRKKRPHNAGWKRTKGRKSGQKKKIRATAPSFFARCFIWRPRALRQSKHGSATAAGAKIQRSKVAGVRLKVGVYKGPAQSPQTSIPTSCTPPARYPVTSPPQPPAHTGYQRVRKSWGRPGYLRVIVNSRRLLTYPRIHWRATSGYSQIQPLFFGTPPVRLEIITPLSNGCVISSGVLEKCIVFAYTVTRRGVRALDRSYRGIDAFYDTNFQILVDDNECWHN